MINGVCYCHLLMSGLIKFIMVKFHMYLENHFLMNKYIFIECSDLDFFYKSLNQQQIHEVIVLFEKIKENLIFTSELDLQIRNDRYYIDIRKYGQLEDLIQFSISYSNYI